MDNKEREKKSYGIWLELGAISCAEEIPLGSEVPHEICNVKKRSNKWSADFFEEKERESMAENNRWTSK